MKLGRTFNHVEDLVFFHGKQGALEALEHLAEVSSNGYNSLRMKWDGSPQIYWGRDEKNGPLIIATHNAWSKNVKCCSGNEIKEFILSTGEFSDNRVNFANKFSQLYSLFDNATPAEFVGFVYADALYLSTPDAINGVFSFSPNPHSNTTFHVTENSTLGNAVAESDVMVVGHAYYSIFGQNEDSQQPIDDFSMFLTNELIVLGPVYNQTPITIEASDICRLQNIAETSDIDIFLERRKGLADLKDIIYRYVNSSSKNKQLEMLSVLHFSNWVGTSNLTNSKKQNLLSLISSHLTSVEIMFKLILEIMNIKNAIISQLKPTGEIWDTNSEGMVRYSNKPLGHVKFVPRHLWTPK